MNWLNQPSGIMGAILVTAAFVVASGCQRKEKLIDIETPGGEVEVERNVDTGEVDVEMTGDGAAEPTGDGL